MINRAFAALLGSALLAAPAYSQTTDAVSAKVALVDLDLSTDADRARLDRRVRQAAGQICGAEPRGVPMRAANLRCRGEVLDDAAVKIARLKDRSQPIQVARRTP